MPSVSGKGKSIKITFDTTEEIFNHILRMAALLSVNITTCAYELAPLTITDREGISTDLSDGNKGHSTSDTHTQRNASTIDLMLRNNYLSPVAMKKDTDRKRKANKYKNDEAYQNKVRKCSRQLYRDNSDYKHSTIDAAKRKYASTKNDLLPKMKKKYKQDIHDKAVTAFRKEILNMPEYICCICNRIFFRKQVKIWQSEEILHEFSDFITTKYYHVCQGECVKACQMAYHVKFQSLLVPQNTLMTNAITLTVCR